MLDDDEIREVREMIDYIPPRQNPTQPDNEEDAEQIEQDQVKNRVTIKEQIEEEIRSSRPPVKLAWNVGDRYHTPLPSVQQPFLSFGHGDRNMETAVKRSYNIYAPCDVSLVSTFFEILRQC